MGKTEVKKPTLSGLIMFFPSLLIAMTAVLDNPFIRLIFQIVLLVFQYILLKSFVSEYYMIEND
jgi:hypothetical protein